MQTQITCRGEQPRLQYLQFTCPRRARSKFEAKFKQKHGYRKYTNYMCASAAEPDCDDRRRCATVRGRLARAGASAQRAAENPSPHISPPLPPCLAPRAPRLPSPLCLEPRPSQSLSCSSSSSSPPHPLPCPPPSARGRPRRSEGLRIPQMGRENVWVVAIKGFLRDDLFVCFLLYVCCKQV